MVGKRTYGDACGIARALDQVGDRWALLVVRELLLGPKRFTDLRDGLPHISPDVLSQRLRELALAGVVRRRTLPPPASSSVYELSERGAALEPVVLELGRWGSGAPFPEGDPALGVDSAVIALETVFDPAAAGELSGTFELRLAAQPFRLRLDRGRFEVARGPAEDPEATIETDPRTLADVLWQGRPVADARRSGELRIGGSRAAATRLLRLFAAPAG